MPGKGRGGAEAREGNEKKTWNEESRGIYMKEEENERGNGEEEPEVVRGEERITLTLYRVSEWGRGTKKYGREHLFYLTLIQTTGDERKSG